ncbi:hypothetical protein ABBQ38_012545 [Trebouxia sp. C0009 RCD-2024]
MAEQACSRDEQLASMQRRCTQDLQTLQAQHEWGMAAQRSAVQQEVEQLTSKLRQEAATHAATSQELVGLKGQIAELLSSQFASPDEVQAAEDGEGDGLARLRQVLQQSVHRAADAEKTKEQLLGVQQQLAAAHQEAARLHEEHEVTLDQLKNKNELLLKEQATASSHTAAMAEQARNCQEELKTKSANDLKELQALHEQALTAQRSAAQQEVEQLRAQLSQQTATHAAKVQEFQGQLDALQKDRSIAVEELQAELAGLKTTCVELRKVQDERDAALQAAAQIRDQHAAVYQELEELKDKTAELLSCHFGGLHEVQAADVGEENGLDRLRQVMQQSASRAAAAESKVQQLLGVQQQLAAAHLEAASLRAVQELLMAENKLVLQRNGSLQASLDANSQDQALDVLRKELAAERASGLELLAQVKAMLAGNSEQLAQNKEAGVPGAQDLAADLAVRVADAEPAQDVKAQGPEDVLPSESSRKPLSEQGPTPLPAQGPIAAPEPGPQSLIAASAASTVATQSSKPAPLEVREVAKKGKKKGTARQQPVVAIQASSASVGTPAIATQAAVVREDNRPAANAQAGGVPRAQDLPAELAQRSSDVVASAATAQDTRVLASKDALPEKSAPASRPDRGPQSLTTESAAPAPASQKSEPAGSEVQEEVVSQAVSPAAATADDGKKNAAPPAMPTLAPHASQPMKTENGKKGKVAEQAVTEVSASSTVAGTPASVTKAATVGEDSKAAARSQAAANLVRLQGLIADMNHTSSAAVPSAAPTQNAEALHPKDAVLEGSAPTSNPDQGPLSLPAASTDLFAAQSSAPAVSEVREVVSQAASQAAAAADDGKQAAALPAPANMAPNSSQPSKAKKGKKGKAGRQAVAASSAPASVTQAGSPGKEDSCASQQSQAAGGMPRAQNLAADLAADLGQRSSDAVPSAAPAQAVRGLLVPEAGGGFDASSTLPPTQDAAPTPAVAPPSSGPQKLASTWWSSHVKHLQRLAGLGKKLVTGTTVLEAVPDAPAYRWPADPALREIGSGGQGTVFYAERWSVDSINGRVKKRAAALKVVPCTTQQQAALLHREAANLQAMQQQTREGRQVTAAYALALMDVFTQSASGQGMLAMSLVEGQLLDEYMHMALEKQTPKQFVETVAHVLQKLLQVLADLQSRNGRSFGDLKPENILMAGGKQLVLIDWCSSRDRNQEAVEGAPSTLGYPSPEVTALGHSQQPSGPLDLHKDDVWAVGVMGLLWLSKGQDMAFGPTRHQAKTLASPQGLAEARERVTAQHRSWAEAHPGSADTMWPAKLSKLLETVKDPAVREQAGAYFLALLHPDPVQRVTASQALQLAFVR